MATESDIFNVADVPTGDGHTRDVEAPSVSKQKTGHSKWPASSGIIIFSIFRSDADSIGQTLMDYSSFYLD
jgi:hypothetical protein